MSSDFNNAPLVAGSIVGLRSFAVDDYGRLVGPTQTEYVFRPGENKAKCPREGLPLSPGQRLTKMVQAYTLQFPVTLRYGSSHTLQVPGASFTIEGEGKPETKVEVEKTEKPEEPQRHRVGQKDCTCGFYAYTDGSNTFKGTNTVTGIVEGYGMVTVGDKGFRAEKLKMLALVVPKKPERFSRYHRFMGWLYDRDLEVLLGLVSVITAVVSFAVGGTLLGTHNPWGFAALPGVPLGMLGLTTALRASDGKFDRPTSEKVMRWDAEHFKRLYPDVAIYDSEKAALKAHPLSKPMPAPPLDPDTPGFWDLPASVSG